MWVLLKLKYQKTNFKESSFDMIVSTMFLHETSYKAVHKIVSEAYRLLKKGGIMIHVEQPPFEKINDLFDQLMGDWDTHNNNEPFWGPMHDMNLQSVALKAGFKKNNILQLPILNKQKKLIGIFLKENPKITCVIGLSTDPERLVDIRKNRMNSLKETENKSYTDFEKIKKEVEDAKSTFKKYKWPMIDVTRKSVEETAASVIKIYEIYKQNV